ncbi:hypothetical protein SAMN05660909_01913 [Chitinophaga terrae (ex Kim and Jung 2007)]|jgi:uncharacterized lipoprotein|uniref:Uncharacterized protein n=1 Tax=Chitinophaga terrae (ex Kim and Jung 2007) TaxID=408074 RepID=A0A1H4B6F9_9BACT|nr:hypothetical protein [Chitinophaga terrae (ex Kim and Jung 2007)]MDQ0106350.1 putative lipoprotein [Chitinophaga terrae (ex Kim and Jung 2007)]SEA43697.1 hypothetical protein SAMN05660909_01913 [Chitinophaga terrae (ex Kim and Jung 2007)]
MKRLIALMLTVSVVSVFAACGNGNHTPQTDSVPADNTLGTDQQDTVPGAQMPPGAINPGEDSSRFGTGAGDSSKTQRP